MHMYNVLLLMCMYIHPHIYSVTTKTSGDMPSQVPLQGIRYFRDR